MTTEVALDPIADADWPADIADLLGGFAGSLNVYRTMAHHPDLLRAWTNLREHVVNQNVLGRQRTEVVILRTGHRLGSSYEWHQHVVRGRKYGLDDARIHRIRGPVAAMPPEDAVLAQAVDELYDTGGLTGEIARALTRAVGTAGVFDLMATVGFYCTLGFILNTFGTPLDDDIQADLDAEPFRPGEPPT